MPYVGKASILYRVDNDIYQSNGAEREILREIAKEALGAYLGEEGLDEKLETFSRECVVDTATFEVGNETREGVGIEQVESFLTARLADVEWPDVVLDSEADGDYPNPVRPTYAYSVYPVYTCDHQYVLLDNSDPAKITALESIPTREGRELAKKALRLTLDTREPIEAVVSYFVVELSFRYVDDASPLPAGRNGG